MKRRRNNLPESGGPRSLEAVCLKVAVLLVLALITGCGNPADACALQGSVTFDGEPISDGVVRLDPVGNRDAARASAIITDGQFEIPLSDGLTAGEYRVAVMAVRKTGRKVVSRESLNGRKFEEMLEEEQYVPPQFNRRSRLRVDLQPGENKEVFALSSAPPQP